VYVKLAQTFMLCQKGHAWGPQAGLGRVAGQNWVQMIIRPLANRERVVLLGTERSVAGVICALYITIACDMHCPWCILMCPAI